MSFLPKWNNVRLKPKLLALFLLVGIAPTVIAGVFAYKMSVHSLEDASELAMQSLKQNALEGLAAVRDEKKSTIEQYFNTMLTQTSTTAKNRMTVEMARDFRKAFTKYTKNQKLDENQIEEMRADLGKYYSDEFNAQYRTKNNNNDSKFGDYLAKLSPTAVSYTHLTLPTNREV